uniref:Uncharacterized protein n=1 Tax=Nelumbo nucifera TaxID=4432 RepID=A0A822Y2J9_NELNU|nr:TPA_asm: hypothetical protein HUJ06_027950 [Nelumbo nucifera]
MVKEISFIRDIIGQLQQANKESKCLHKPEALKSLHTRTNVDIVTVLKRGVPGGRGDREDYIKWGRNGRGGAIEEGGAGAREGKVLETVLEIQDRHGAVKEIEGKYGTL